MANRKRHLKIVKQPASLAEIIAGMPIKFLWCRDIGHKWDPYTVDVDGRHRQFVETIFCERCGSFRVRRISRSGVVLKSRYKYADGYLIPSYARATTKDARAKIRVKLAFMVVEDAEAQA